MENTMKMRIAILAAGTLVLSATLVYAGDPIQGVPIGLDCAGHWGTGIDGCKSLSQATTGPALKTMNRNGTQDSGEPSYQRRKSLEGHNKEPKENITNATLTKVEVVQDGFDLRAKKKEKQGKH
jgi:hypothetical protein